MHPPADRRCQLYIQRPKSDELVRCANPGTHWEAFGSCGCIEPRHEACEEVIYSWECDGHGWADDLEAA
jgi:hypothetical protein